MSLYMDIRESLIKQYSEDLEVHLQRGWYNMVTETTDNYTDTVLVDFIMISVEHTQGETYDLLCMIDLIINYTSGNIDMFKKDVTGTSIYAICHNKGLHKIIEKIQVHNNHIHIDDISIGI